MDSLEFGKVSPENQSAGTAALNGTDYCRPASTCIVLVPHRYVNLVSVFYQCIACSFHGVPGSLALPFPRREKRVS